MADPKYEFTEQTIEVDGRTLRRIRALRTFGSVVVGELGGWIEDETNLDHDGYSWVGEEARIFAGGRVQDSGHARRQAVVRDGSVVSDGAYVGGGAVVSDSLVGGGANVTGSAEVIQSRVIHEARISGRATVKNSMISGTLYVMGEALVDDQRHLGPVGCIRGTGYLSGVGQQLFAASGVGRESGVLSVYRATCAGDLEVTRGCFTGTVEEFLEKSAMVHDERTQRQYRRLLEIARERILG